MSDKNKQHDIPPMRDEHNQKEIDAEQARILREAAEQRKAVDDIEKSLPKFSARNAPCFSYGDVRALVVINQDIVPTKTDLRC
jgi:hypothetical protein